MGKLEGTYCPLCGEMGLQEGRLGGDVVAYCPQGTGVNGPENAHTCCVIGRAKERPTRTPPPPVEGEE